MVDPSSRINTALTGDHGQQILLPTLVTPTGRYLACGRAAMDKEGEVRSTEKRKRIDDGDKRFISKFWDRDDPTTWAQFKYHDYLHRLLPFPRSLEYGKEILGYPIFELYDIVIRRLDGDRKQDFDMILLIAYITRSVPFVIYKREPPQTKDIDTIIGRPLPLKGHVRLLSAEDFVTIVVNNPANGGDWFFKFDPFPRREVIRYDEPLSEVFEDEDTDSAAVVSYEIMKEAVKAMLVFRFIDPQQEEGGGGGEGQLVQIMSGTISVAHGGGGKQPDATKRIVKHFPSHKPPTVVNTGNVVPVDRHVFGVPCGSIFQVTAENLICTATATALGGEQGGSCCFSICETLYFGVPTHTLSEEQCFTKTNDSTALQLTVSWANAWS